MLMLMLIKQVLIYGILMYFGIAFGYSKDAILLFDEAGEYKNNYNELVLDLKSYDIVQMPDGKKFKVLQKIFSGKTTAVLRVVPIGHAYAGLPGEEYILRIPRGKEWKTIYNFYLKSSPDLAKTQLNIPKFFYADKKYVVTENIEHSFNGKEFLEDSSSIKKQHSKELWDKAALKLKEFAKANSHIIYVGDFKADQLIYDLKNEKWRLIDWKEGLSKYEGVDMRKHLFDLENLSTTKVPIKPSLESAVLLHEIDLENKESRLVDYLNTLRPDKNIQKLSDFLVTQEDYKKLYDLVKQSGNDTYAEALMTYFLENKGNIFAKFPTASDIGKFSDYFKNGKVEKSFKVRLAKERLKSVQNASEFSQILTHLVGLNNLDVSSSLDQIWAENVDRFFSLNPQKDDFNDVVRLINNPQYKEMYINAAYQKNLITEAQLQEFKDVIEIDKENFKSMNSSPNRDIKNRQAVLDLVSEIEKELEREDELVAQTKSNKKAGILGALGECLRKMLH